MPDPDFLKISNITSHQIDLFNSVLGELNVPRLGENPDFLLDENLQGHHFVKIQLKSSGKRTVPLAILFEGDGIRLDIFGIEESFEWSNDEIFTNRANIISFLKKLLTSYVLVELCDSAARKSRVYLFDTHGNLVRKFALRGLIQNFSGWNCEKILFFPVYSDKQA
jgi:hypothetical protein